jgi:hypothetical protein
MHHVSWKRHHIKGAIMKKYAVLCAALCLFTSQLFAEELTAEKKQALKELMEITGAAKMGEMFGAVFVQQMTAFLKQSNPDIDPKAYTIVDEEITKLMHEEFVEKESLQELIYPIYHNYLSLAETRELIRFYKTPVGMKAISVMPQMAQEGMQAGQVWGQTLGPEIERRITARFEKEGITLK